MAREDRNKENTTWPGRLWREARGCQPRAVPPYGARERQGRILLGCQRDHSPANTLISDLWQYISVVPLTGPCSGSPWTWMQHRTAGISKQLVNQAELSSPCLAKTFSSNLYSDEFAATNLRCESICTAARGATFPEHTRRGDSQCGSPWGVSACAGSRENHPMFARPGQDQEWLQTPFLGQKAEKEQWKPTIPLQSLGNVLPLIWPLEENTNLWTKTQGRRLHSARTVPGRIKRTVFRQNWTPPLHCGPTAPPWPHPETPALPALLCATSWGEGRSRTTQSPSLREMMVQLTRQTQQAT